MFTGNSSGAKRAGTWLSWNPSSTHQKPQGSSDCLVVVTFVGCLSGCSWAWMQGSPSPRRGGEEGQ